jgi:hypothetical protein
MNLILLEPMPSRGRPPKYDWALLLDIDNTPCGLKDKCSGAHAGIWQLARGEDFPTTMKIPSLQTAMHAKAKHLGIGCHTRKHKTGLQVQFFIPKESSDNTSASD